MDNFKLYIDPIEYEKVVTWVNTISPREVSGYGLVERVDGNYHITEAFLLPQKVNTGASTEIDSVELLKLENECISKPGCIMWQWHSHPNGIGLFNSGTDLENIREHVGKHSTWLFSVFDEAGDTFNSFCTAKPAMIYLDKIELVVTSSVDQDTIDAWVKEANAKVAPLPLYTPPSYPSTTLGNYARGDYNSHTYFDEGQAVHEKAVKQNKMNQFSIADINECRLELGLKGTPTLEQLELFEQYTFDNQWMTEGDMKKAKKLIKQGKPYVDTVGLYE